MKQLTDIQIAKKLVKEQKERRENNFVEFKEVQDGKKKHRKNWKERLKKGGHI